MGMSVSTTRIYIQTGVDNQEEMKKYNELKQAAKNKLGSNFTAEHDRICSILAKDPNATVEDVESMYNKVNQDGIWGAEGTSKEQRLQSFQRALKQVPGYSNTNLSAENLNDLLDIYNGSYIAQIAGKTQMETFINDAEQYIKDLNKPEISVSLRDNLRTEQLSLANEYLAQMNKAQIVTLSRFQARG